MEISGSSNASNESGDNKDDVDPDNYGLIKKRHMVQSLCRRTLGKQSLYKLNVIILYLQSE